MTPYWFSLEFYWTESNSLEIEWAKADETFMGLFSLYCCWALGTKPWGDFSLTSFSAYFCTLSGCFPNEAILLIKYQIQLTLVYSWSWLKKLSVHQYLLNVPERRGSLRCKLLICVCTLLSRHIVNFNNWLLVSVRIWLLVFGWLRLWLLLFYFLRFFKILKNNNI